MRIVLFTDTLGDLNGVSRFIQDMGEQAALRTLSSSPEEAYQQVELHIVTSTSKALPDEAYIHNLAYRFRMSMPFYQEMDLVLPNKKAIVRKLQELKPDVVHISTPGPFGWQAKTVAEKMGYPLIGTYHTDFPAYLYDLSKMLWVKHLTDKLMARFYRPFKHVFSRSQTYLEVMASDIEIDYDRASVLSAGTNLDKFHIEHQDFSIWQHFGLSEQRQKVLYVGRINIEKNIPFLIQVWKKLLETYPDINADLVMVGEGRYRKWADKLRDKHAYFIGPVTGKRLSQLYASSDLFVFPSITDTLGQVVMEAQASGLGCLVSDIGGPQTLVIDNETGRIIKSNDKQAWIEAIYNALKIQHNENTWQTNSRLHIEQYNIADSFNHFIQVHKQVLAKINEPDSTAESTTSTA